MTGFESVVGVNPWTALFTFCNLIITFLLLRKFLFKPVKKMIDDRQKEIDGLYADADRSKQEAQALKEEYASHIESAKDERDEILKNANLMARQQEQTILAEASQKAAAMKEKAQKDIEQEKKRAINEVKGEISGIAMEIASKVVEREVKPSDHEDLVEQFIERLGDQT